MLLGVLRVFQIMTEKLTLDKPQIMTLQSSFRIENTCTFALFSSAAVSVSG